MLRALTFLLLPACGTVPQVPPPSPEALVFHAPARDGHPAFVLQLLAPADLLDVEAVFPPLLGAIGDAFATCAVTADDAETFLLEGELRVGPGGALALQTISSDARVRCVGDAFTAAGAVGPTDLDVSLPAALVIADG